MGKEFVPRHINSGDLRTLRRVAGDSWSGELVTEAMNNGAKLFLEQGRIVGFQISLGDAGDATVFGRLTKKFVNLSPMMGDSQGSLQTIFEQHFNSDLDDPDNALKRRDRRHGGGVHDKKYSHAQFVRAKLRQAFGGKIKKR